MRTDINDPSKDKVVRLIPEPSETLDELRAQNELKIMANIVRHKWFCTILTYTGILVLLVNAGLLAINDLPGWRWFLMASIMIWVVDKYIEEFRMPLVTKEQLEYASQGDQEGSPYERITRF